MTTGNPAQHSPLPLREGAGGGFCPAGVAPTDKPHPNPSPEGEGLSGAFTGRHLAIIMIGFFAVVVAVNLLMARLAGSTFGGVVVKNSYVASQQFNRWLDAAAQERSLGWQAAALRRGDGRLAVTLTGAPEIAVVTATARHPLGRMPDIRIAFARDMAGTFVSNEVLPAGRWRLRLEAQAAGQTWRGEQDVR